jgi:hypothetical protein
MPLVVIALHLVKVASRRAFLAAGLLPRDFHLMDWNLCLWNLCLWNLCLWNLCLWNLCLWNPCLWNLNSCNL